MAQETKLFRLSDYPRIRKFITLFFIAAIIWYPAMYLIFPTPPAPYYGISTISTALVKNATTTGDSGYNITTLETQPTNRSVLVNETPFKCGYGWRADTWRGSKYSQVEDGVLIQVGPSYTLSDREPYLELVRTFYISHNDTSEISVSIKGKGVNENVTVTCLVVSNFWSIRAPINESIVSVPNQSFELTCRSQVPELEADSDTLLIRVFVILYVSGPDLSEVLIESIEFIGELEHNLCKLTLDYLDNYGNSIKASEGGAISNAAPEINITGNGLSTEIWFPHFNMTMYLREGEYSIEEIRYGSSHDVSYQNLVVTLQQNQTTWVGIYHPFPRMYFDVQPDIPSVDVIVSYYWDSRTIVWFSVQGDSYPDFIYLPPGRFEINVEIRTSRAWDTYNDLSYSFDRETEHHDSSVGHNWVFHINTSMRTVGSIAIPDYFLLPLLLVPALSAGYLTNFVSDKDKRIQDFWKSPEFYPIILLCSSVLLPWMMLRTGNNWNFVHYLPLSSDLISVNSSIEVFSTSIIGKYFALGLNNGFIFWIAVGFLILLSDFQSKVQHVYFACFLSIPFIMSLTIIIQCLLLPVSLGIGTILSLLAFPVWISLKGIIHFRNKSFSSPMARVKHGNPGIGATKSSAYVPLK